MYTSFMLLTMFSMSPVNADVLSIGPWTVELKKFKKNATVESENEAFLLDYVLEYICKPNCGLGRKGPVCPFMPAAVKNETFWLGKVTIESFNGVNLEQGELNSLYSLVRAVKEWLKERQAAQEMQGLTIFYSALLYFDNQEAPSITENELIELQRTLKSEFVRDGMMIGEFTPHNEEPGLYSESFRPFRSEIPFIGIRFLHQKDLVFMSQSKDDLETQLICLKSFVSRNPKNETALEMLNIKRQELKTNNSAAQKLTTFLLTSLKLSRT
jgi:hypothetical protein